VLGLASLSAYAKSRIPGLRVTLVPIKEGTSQEDFVQEVLDIEPDLLGVSSTTPTWPSVMPYLTELGDRVPELPIVVGGYHAVLCPGDVLSHPAVRYVCPGEGEQPLVDLIFSLVHADGAPVSGLWEKTLDGEMRTSPPLVMTDASQLPFPDYSIYASRNSLDYWGPHGVESSALLTVPVLTGRGCPHRCSYCNNSSLLEIYRGRGK